MDEDLPDADAPSSAPTPGPRRHRLRWALVAVAGVLVAAGVIVWVTREEARPVSLDEARERASTSSEDDDSAAPVARPAEGVYEYEGTGTESLSVPPLSQDEGPIIPGTVEHLADGCWLFRLDYSTNHWQTWTYCASDDGVVEQGGETWQRWDIGATTITNLSSFTCDDGSPALPTPRRVDQEWTARCVGTNERVEGETVSEGPYRYVGTEVLEVGGEEVRAAHFESRRTVTGAQDGSEHIEVWFAEDTGLLLRNERTIEVASDTPIGPSEYSEVGEVTLVSLTPTT